MSDIPSRGTMPLLEHFRELRKRVVRSAIAILFSSIVSLFFYTDIINTLAKPICDLSTTTNTSHCGTLYINGVLGPLNLQITVSLIVGLIVSAPYWLYQLWAFVAPGLHKREKRNSIFFLLGATPFFAVGSTLGYLVLPIAVKVLLGLTPDSLNNLVRFDDYLNFVLRLIFVFGIAFELPVFLVSLNLVGVVTGRGILKPWRFAIFGIAFFTAAFSPTGDPLTMSLLALPLVFFYFAAGLLGMWHDSGWKIGRK